MKCRISATIDKSTLEIIKKALKNRKYRNKSHVIEEALLILKEKENLNEE